MSKKLVSNILLLKKGDITNKANWPNDRIDTMVNAAKPTLMGSNQGVDGSIHKAVNRHLVESKSTETSLYACICKELGHPQKEEKILCERGNAVCTSGYGFCRYIIHAVGTVYDGPLHAKSKTERIKFCSSSCLSKLESCYYEIVNIIKQHLDIEVVGIPMIGAGEYKIPFKIAAELAIVSVGNALLDWKKQDEEVFQMSKLKQIIFFIYNVDHNICEENYKCAQKIMAKYHNYFRNDKNVVYQNSVESHFRIIKDILLYDHQRGYFAIAKWIRMLLMSVRTLFLPMLCLKDLIGKRDWERRRQSMEILSFVKVFLPFFFWWALQTKYINQSSNTVEIIVSAICIYCLADTLSYLLFLILMSDIQRPSANLIRSIILLFVNYLEMASDLALLTYIYYRNQLENYHFRQSLAFGFLSQSIKKEPASALDYIFIFLDSGMKFFLITLVIGYFYGHMRHKKFRS